jgi:hypothetical protein
MADAFKGVWFAGYTEEPYTFKVLGKSNSRLPLLVADFLPDGEELAIVAADADGEMHILEVNPAREYPALPKSAGPFKPTPGQVTNFNLQTADPWKANSSCTTPPSR